MTHSGPVDQDDIIRARNTLLASGRRTPREEVDAYRVLAHVSPASYRPRLVTALQHLSYDATVGRHRPDALALCEEAVAVARTIDSAEPAREDLLYGALDSCQRRLYAAGRRAEGLALRAEMLAVGRARAARTGDPVVRGLETWSAGLSEEGRYAEAADAMTELMDAFLPVQTEPGTHAWSLLRWIAALDDAGRTDEALGVFARLVAMEATEAAEERGPLACHLYALTGYAQLLATHGRRAQAAAVRQEALAVLTELAATGERRSWSGYQSTFWAVLLPRSGAVGEPPSDGGPLPPSGTTPREWSPDARRRHADSLGPLREAVATFAAHAAEAATETATDSSEDAVTRRLTELIRLQRLLTVRSAVHWEDHHHVLFPDRVRPLFDDGVRLARRLLRHDPATGAPVLAQLLVDRATFRTAAEEFGPALADFREALDHLGEAPGPVEPGPPAPAVGPDVSGPV
ncbi:MULTISPECIES: hypothetical protein [unclassified Streptomyces]|uniref:hypothetical protein n=1 Tax=unclassified Streptomyces TaxID=2593676 RepID=UPI0038156BC8